ncbi:MAG: signal peptidase I [Burkholderiales bacterium]|nr:signal peptidase I [Burkholderiales bacterium]
MEINWTYVACAALFAGPFFIWLGGRKGEAIFDAEQMPESALWGYFLILIGGWGVLAQWANPSDLFFVIMLVAAVMALVARLMGYKAKGGDKALPSWAAFGFSNALVLALIGLGKTFVVEPMQIPSSSMRPGLVIGDFILVNKFNYGLRVPFLNEPVIAIHHPQRGDVVVFRYPEDPKQNFIKRLIGLPGDKIDYHNKLLTINGESIASNPVGEYKDKSGNRLNDNGSRVDESYNFQAVPIVMAETFNNKPHQTLNTPGKTTLNPYDVASFDHKENCKYDDDGSGFACTIPQGHYLMLGDNRDDSRDSRYWGFVREDQLVGKAFMIWMNFHDPARIGTTIK